jgi:hypothetical protein
MDSDVEHLPLLLQFHFQLIVKLRCKKLLQKFPIFQIDVVSNQTLSN